MGFWFGQKLAQAFIPSFWGFHSTPDVLNMRGHPAPALRLFPGVAQALASQLKSREDAVSATERRLDVESRALQQQRQEAELAGMKAQLAVQQQQHSPLLSSLLQPNPQLMGRSASRLQVRAELPCSHH